MDKITEAKKYLSLGWSPIPIDSGTKKPAMTCVQSHKHVSVDDPAEYGK